MSKQRICFCYVFWAAAFWWSDKLSAQVEPFYKAPWSRGVHTGEARTTHGRMITKHLDKPGSPTLVVQNMPGRLARPIT